MKKFFSILLSFLVFLICLKPLPVLASSGTVTSYTGTWGSYPFHYIGTGKYYIIDDPTGLTPINNTAPKYFYTIDGVKFDEVPGTELLTLLYNKVIGVIIDPDDLDSFYNGFWTSIGLLDTVYNKYKQDGLYDSNDNYYGQVINDISGCYYAKDSSDGFDVPSSFNNNLRTYFDNSNTCDYFDFSPITNESILNNYSVQGFWTSDKIGYFNTFVASFEPIYGIKTGSDNSFTFADPQNLYKTVGAAYGASGGNSSFDDFCKVCGLSTGSTLSYSKLMAIMNGHSSDCNFSLNFYKSDNTWIRTTDAMFFGNGSIASGMPNSYFNFGKSSSYVYTFFGLQHFTIYRTSSVKPLLDTETYKPGTYITDSYNTYDSNNDNSTTVDKSVTGHAITYDGDIYDLCNGSFYTYYDNGYVDTSGMTTNNTTITNNYYNSNPDPDPDPDPDDNNTLDAILSAILRFFNAIGDIIGTILAGLINMIDAVLESIAGIMEDLDGLTDFFGALFAWIPDPVPQLIGAGISLCILAAIIKFIRG